MTISQTYTYFRLYFQHGITYFCSFYSDAAISNILLHLLLLLVVLWIYGQQHFQRDVEFMLGQPFASWKIYILRYIAPCILLICMVCYRLITCFMSVKALIYIFSTVMIISFISILMALFHTVCSIYCYYWWLYGSTVENVSSGMLSLYWVNRSLPGRCTCSDS